MPFAFISLAQEADDASQSTFIDKSGYFDSPDCGRHLAALLFIRHTLEPLRRLVIPAATQLDNGGGGMGLIMLIFWIMVIAAVVLLISGAQSNRSSVHGKHVGRPALNILKQRYACGEIDQATYEAMKGELLQ